MDKQLILILSEPVPSTTELRRDLEKVKERMNGIKNMPELEETK